MSVHVIPPVVEVTVASSVDVMCASDAARRVADLQGFSPIYQAMAAGAAQSLAEWLCRTQKEHKIEFYGLQSEQGTGFQIACKLNWVKGINAHNIEIAMQAKLADLVDEISLKPETDFILHLTLWLSEERKAIVRMKGDTS